MKQTRDGAHAVFAISLDTVSSLNGGGRGGDVYDLHASRDAEARIGKESGLSVHDKQG